ncbi:MAG: hypothetical protein ACPGF6_00695 [Porticoccaceae bacterium]
MNLDKLIDLLLQKGFTAVTGAVGLKLILVDGIISADDRVEILFIGALLLSIATAVSYLSWKTRVTVRHQKSIAADKAIADELAENP